ncbi:hypothetical protein [Flavobacterium sp.]|uniref:hypothetical protein n=1 Tax=Flavobacterium sp. TaxID=239 RepID=UPI00261EB5EB|nr:hypothetical protein [Flavobacterium sp.]
MDFNELQSAWNNDNPKNVVLPETMEQLKAANTPLDKIKKNLRNEFYYQGISIVILGFVPLIKGFPESALVPFYLLFAIFTAVCIYYLVKLFIFYRRLGNTALNTKDSLYETYVDIRINMELYKTFGFALTPFVILFLLGVLFYKLPAGAAFFSGNIDNSVLVTLVCSVVFSILFMGLAGEWWVHYFYGKYAREIRKILDTLKEE